VTLRPHELRELLEREVHEAFDAVRRAGNAVDPVFLVATVLARYQHRPDVQGRLEFLWSHLEAYVGMLETMARAK
jgi:hypothetical protein